MSEEKKITYCSHRVEHGCGTSKYHVEWVGDWTAEELINYCDGGSGNYGGRIENIRDTGLGTKRGTVCVYYD